MTETESSKRTKKRYIKISDEEYQRLQHEYENNPSRIIRRKCHAIILRAKYPTRGEERIQTINEVKSNLRVSEKTIDRWISEYCESGIDEFLKLKYKPRKGRLDDIREQLCRDLNEGTFMTVGQIIDHIHKKYSITISPTQTRFFLHKNDITWGKTVSK